MDEQETFDAPAPQRRKTDNVSRSKSGFRETLIAKAVDQSNSDNLDELKKTLELIQLVDAIGEPELDRTIRHPKRFRLLNWATKETALIAVFITALTFLAQTGQFILTGYLQKSANEDAQWRSAVKAFSLDRAGGSLSGALTLETFYDSGQHGDRARAMVADSLFYLADPAAFDTLFFNLKENLRPGDAHYIYEVAKRESDKEWGLYSYLLAEDSQLCGGQKKANITCFRDLPSNLDALPDGSRLNKDLVAEANLLDWEIDSATSGILGVWATKKVNPFSAGKSFPSIVLRFASSIGPAHPNDDSNMIRLDGIDLSDANFAGAYLSHLRLANSTSLARADLKDSDLSWTDFGATDISGATFDNAHIDCADLSKVTKVDGSSWNGVDLNQAIAVSDELQKYLKDHWHLSSLKLSTDKCNQMPSGNT